MSTKSNLTEIHTAVLLFGFAGLFGKWLMLSPFIIVLGRVLFASLALWIFIQFSSWNLKVTPPKNYLYFLLLGLILSVHWASFFHSIQISTVAVGLLSYSSFPLFTTFLEPVLLKENLELPRIFYALLCIFGVFLIIPRFELSSATYRGVLWGLFSGLSFSLLTILNRKLTQKFSYLLIAFYQDLFAVFFLLPFLFLLKPSFQLQEILLLVVLGVICTAGSHTLFIKGIKGVPAQTAAIISSLEPVYGIILAYLFLHEIPALRTIGGGLIILGAVFLISLQESRSTPHLPPAQ
ncbi:DMT family transporter [bacterium]|nr:DMT family transporter [bacterium]